MNKKGAGRPHGSFKYGIPVQKFKKLNFQARTLWNIKRRLVNEAIERLDLATKIENHLYLAKHRLEVKRKLQEAQK